MKKLISLVLTAAIMTSAFLGAFAVTVDYHENRPVFTPSEEASVTASVSMADNAEEQTVGGSRVIAEGTDPIAITTENVRVYGRNIDKTGGVQTSWCNTGIEIHFYGRGVSVEIVLSGASSGGLPYVQVWLDGERTARRAVSNGSSNYIFASRLAEGEHTLKVLLVTENFYTPLTFKSLTLTGNEPKLLEPVYDPDQIILDCYGDSITAGHGTIKGYANYCTAASDASTTYAGFTGERLGADMQTIAISGWGMYQGYGGDRNGIIPRVWKFESMSNSKVWDGFAKRQADIVTICLGTNDMWFWNDLDPELYINAYVEFLRDIRSVYPEAYIFCLFGCMGEYNGFYDKVQESTRRFCLEDEIGACYVKMPEMGIDPDNFTGTNGHPSKEYGEYACSTLLDAIEKFFYKDWQYKLLEAAEKLELIDEAGVYANVVEQAKLTAADRTSTGRNPKRFCKELEALINDFSNPAADALSETVGRAKALLASEDTSENACRVIGILAAKAQELIDGNATAEAMYAAEAVLSGAIANAADDSELEKIDLGGDFVSAKFSLDGETYTDSVEASAGDDIYIKVRSLVNANGISGKLMGDPLRSSKRGTKLPSSVSEGYMNGVYDYVYKVRFADFAELKLTVGGDSVAIPLKREAQPSAEPTFGLAPQELIASATPAAPSRALIEAGKAAADGNAKVAVFGTSSLAERLSHVWTGSFGGSVGVCGNDSVIMACANIGTVLAGSPDVVILALGRENVTAEQDKELLESAVRTLLTADKAPAVIIISTAQDEEIDAGRRQIAAAYGLPFASAAEARAKLLADGTPALTVENEAGRFTKMFMRVLAETAIGGFYASLELTPCELPEAVTAVSFMNMTVYTPDNITPTKISNYTVQSYEGEWPKGWEGTRGTIKFALENAGSVIVVYGDVGGGASGLALVKSFGSSKSQTFNYEPYSTNAFIAYSGAPATGEFSMTLTFNSKTAIYAIIVGE